MKRPLVEPALNCKPRSHRIGKSDSGSILMADVMINDDAAAHQTGVSVAVVKGYVVAAPQAQLSGEVIANLRDRLLTMLSRTSARHVYIDCSGLEVMDTEEFRALRNLATMAKMLGAVVLLGGLRPSVVAALVTMGESGAGLRTALSLDDAVSLFDDETS